MPFWPHPSSTTPTADRPAGPGRSTGSGGELCQGRYMAIECLVPYVMPGFRLAKAAPKAYEAAAAWCRDSKAGVAPSTALFSFAPPRSRAYDRMIRLVQARRRAPQQAERPHPAAAVPSARPTPASAVASGVAWFAAPGRRARGGTPTAGCLDCRSSAPALELVTTMRLSRWASCGVGPRQCDPHARPPPWCCRPRRLPQTQSPPRIAMARYRFRNSPSLAAWSPGGR